MNVSDSHHRLQPSFVGWVGLPASTKISPRVRSRMGLTSSHHFSQYMSRSSTPTDPPESYQIDSFVLASIAATMSPPASLL